MVAMTVVTLETSEVAVEVTIDCMPPMSLAMRDWTSPVRVRVKKASGMRCRWRVDCGAQVVHDALADVRRQPASARRDRALVTIATAIMPPTSHASSWVFRCGSAVVEHVAQQERRHHRNPC